MKTNNKLMILLTIVSTLVIGAWTNSAAIATYVDPHFESIEFPAMNFESDNNTNQTWDYLAKFYATYYASLYYSNYSEMSESRGWTNLDEFYANTNGGAYSSMA